MADALVMEPLSGGSARLVRRFSTAQRHLGLWIALWVAVVLGEVGALAQFVLERTAPVEPVQVVFRLVGGSFAVCGLIAWHRRPDSHSGRLLAATGFAFFVSPLLSLIDSPVARTAAHVFPDLWVLPFVALVLTFLTAGRLRTPVDRVLVGAVLIEIVVLAPLYVLFSETEGSIPFFPMRVSPSSSTPRRRRCSSRSASPPPPWCSRGGASRRPPAGAPWLPLSPELPACSPSPRCWPCRSPAAAARRCCSGSRPACWSPSPSRSWSGLLRSRLARGGVASLFRELRTMRPDDLQAALARALGDPALVLAYPGPDGSYVDAGARRVTLPEPGGDRSVAIVERDGEAVAALVYDRSLDDDPELVDAVGGAATIALENRHLHAEAQLRRAELEASRARIITAADAERRRIERNLHDGAQQRLVTLALQLSLIQREIRRDPGGAEELVTLASGELAQSLEELRELARGIHPAALDQGLEPALEALALRSAVPTVVTCDPGPRLPQPVEFAAYFVASEALANVAKYARATAATVRVVRTATAVDVEIADNGVGGADPAAGTGLRGLGDRIEALHGRLRVSSPPGAGTVVTAEIPLGDTTT